jgi:rhomboid family GlyGly-CTERM serine protease
MPATNQENRLPGATPRPQLPAITLVLVVAAVTVMPFDALTSWLQYDRAAVDGGQLWRLLTCQLTHWSWDHLFWDAAALLFLGRVLEREERRSLLVCLGLSAVLIPAVVHFSLPDLATYRGLSGLDSAVFVLLAVTLLRRCYIDGDRLWTWACVAMLVGFTAKVGFEVISGGTLFVDSEAARMLPVPLVHVVGGVLGACCGIRGTSPPSWTTTSAVQYATSDAVKR